MYMILWHKCDYFSERVINFFMTIFNLTETVNFYFVSRDRPIYRLFVLLNRVCILYNFNSLLCYYILNTVNYTLQMCIAWPTQALWVSRTQSLLVSRILNVLPRYITVYFNSMFKIKIWFDLIWNWWAVHQ